LQPNEPSVRHVLLVVHAFSKSLPDALELLPEGLLLFYAEGVRWLFPPYAQTWRPHLERGRFALLACPVAAQRRSLVPADAIHMAQWTSLPEMLLAIPRDSKVSSL
jgi:hypothetical protein